MPDRPVDISVAICTWNRARLLEQTLAQLCRLVVPSGLRWELAVIDNSCTDDTSAVIDRYKESLPIRSFVEPRLGLSHARNRAVAEARGEVLLWTDDDVLVSPDWLANYARAFREWPQAAYFGGPIQPWFAKRRLAGPADILTVSVTCGLSWTRAATFGLLRPTSSCSALTWPSAWTS